MARWKVPFRASSAAPTPPLNSTSASTNTLEKDGEQQGQKRTKWSLGILNHPDTDEVPGSVLLLSNVSKRNEPLGLRHAPARTSASSLPSPYPPELRRQASSHSTHSEKKRSEKKRTADGKIILEPQPDDSANDPLNWSTIRRDAALLSLGFYCMVGGGMTPILAAGFQNIAQTYGVSVPQVALTTGLYMMGLGVGSVVMSPTAILYGKRPVYLVTSVLFILSSVWCALSPNYTSLLIARIVQGIAVSPVECLPSATVAEIFFLHERAYRLGIYTLLLLGGKNLVPLVSAAIIQSMGWRWVFWMVAIIVGFCAIMLFLFVPETFWDRTPRPRHIIKREEAAHSHTRLSGHGHHHEKKTPVETQDNGGGAAASSSVVEGVRSPGPHVGFAEDKKVSTGGADESDAAKEKNTSSPDVPEVHLTAPEGDPLSRTLSEWSHPQEWDVETQGEKQDTPDLHNLNSPYYEAKAKEVDYFSLGAPGPETIAETGESVKPATGKDEALPLASPSRSILKPSHTVDRPVPPALSKLNTTIPSPPISQTISPSEEKRSNTDPERASHHLIDDLLHPHSAYTHHFRHAPPKSFLQTLRPYSGRLRTDNWFHIALRPFILFAYPSILWSTVVYSLSVGWLIVLSESVSTVYRNRETYNFTALQVGLVYISPFVGGVLGTAVAGKVSDYIVRFMARRNDGVYEPEFRLVMAIPVAVCTTVGLMGFGWSAQERDAWIVPTVFFGIVGFGCSLGSTTAITFAVDCYRQYAGEALVTLNFSKNIFHGLVFSLFFTHWLEADGAKNVFIATGAIQMACLLFTIPMYIYGKRARMWTVKKDLMGKF